TSTFHVSPQPQLCDAQKTTVPLSNLALCERFKQEEVQDILICVLVPLSRQRLQSRRNKWITASAPFCYKLWIEQVCAGEGSGILNVTAFLLFGFFIGLSFVEGNWYANRLISVLSTK
ncbi:hypothetical protein KIN20_022234, partial [Parelaphostrongylus tenuis]